ncbi:SAM-dependent methyltransferase [Streptacidiphilus carbonis]|uniref:SAM-dependent methyltransferase n=1 Tax=Streptacidiphilus carbonis TaxID=105422 RepID=UPI0005AACDDF|nr:class I SAM-dependent methyltransferase [Streptacidiphilus carbonis]
MTDDLKSEPQRESDAAFWDARYQENHRIWSGNPNAALVKEVAGLTPGRALDLGCGEGADAIWLARQGWQVTATDISQVALGRAAEQGTVAGVADRIDWQLHDLGASFPTGSFDLVSAQYLHSRGDTMPRERILRSAAGAVAPGGVLLIVGHSGVANWEHNHHPEVHLPSPEEVLAALALPADKWETLVCEEHENIRTAPDGTVVGHTDNTLKLRRLPD